MQPPKWIVDDGPLHDLSMVVEASAVASWPKDQFLVADATADAASGTRETLLKSASSPFSSFSVMSGTQAFDILYTHLRDGATSDKNLAEHQSIAYALESCSSAILVAADRRALYLALAELGRGGAAHPTELWLHLRDNSLINDDQFKDLCERTRKGDQSKIPLRCQ